MTTAQHQRHHVKPWHGTSQQIIACLEAELKERYEEMAMYKASLKIEQEQNKKEVQDGIFVNRQP